jgi:hypothetical protein
MTIEILYVADCPHYEPATLEISKALRQEQLSAEVKHIEIRGQDMAEALSFLGSPTIRINGIDIEASARNANGFGMCCRCYGTSKGKKTGPSAALIHAAIREIGLANEVPPSDEVCK